MVGQLIFGVLETLSRADEKFTAHQLKRRREMNSQRLELIAREGARVPAALQVSRQQAQAG